MKLLLTSPYDVAILILVLLHLLFSFAAAAFVLRFHHRSSSPPPSLHRRLRLLLGLNSLWPVRLLLVLFACLLSLSELLRLSLSDSTPCRLYSMYSQSFAEPAFFATLLFLLRASTSQSKTSASISAALASAILACFPFILLHALYLLLSPWALKKLSLPPDYLSAPSSFQRCTHPLYGTVLLAGLGIVYVPLFVSACWGAVTVVINKKLRIRLYLLAAAVVAALTFQVSALAVSALWGMQYGEEPQGLALAAFVAVLVSVGVGEGILVVQPVVDALAIVVPEVQMSNGVEFRVKDGDLEG